MTGKDSVICSLSKRIGVCVCLCVCVCVCLCVCLAEFHHILAPPMLLLLVLLPPDYGKSTYWSKRLKF